MMFTSKMETFCQAVADGLNHSDAYRKAYSTEKMKPEAVWSKAYKLLKNGQVRDRISELKNILESKNLWTREQSVSILSEIASNGDKGSDRVAAVKELNAMHGYNAPTQHDVSIVLERSYGK